MRRTVARDGLVIGAAAVLLALAPVPDTGRVYTVAQVAAGLAHHPRAWMGRTVTVRGMVAVLTYSTPASEGNGTCGVQCIMDLPRGAQAHLYLVEETRTGTAAYMRLISAVQVEGMGHHGPPLLVVRVPASRAQPALGALAPTMRRLVGYLPDGVTKAIYGTPTLARLAWTDATLQAATTQVYRVRLLAPDPAGRDDAVLDEPLH